jgi:hypothetical protein
MTKDRICLAVLIDADNISPLIADRLFEEVAKLGDAGIRRLYGDFTGSSLKGWTAAAERHAINVRQQHAYIKHKNASDIALVIEAMDLLHGGLVNGFCIVSSDSDFNSLAIRIREQGLPVFGFGESKTADCFQRACQRFLLTDGWANGTPALAEKSNVIELPRSRTAEFVALIHKALAGNEDQEGWVTLSHIGKRMRELAPDFDRGSKSLSVQLRETSQFDVEIRKDCMQARRRLKNRSA